jgi:tetratricopeptide (TPR) repeat protein
VRLPRLIRQTSLVLIFTLGAARPVLAASNAGLIDPVAQHSQLVQDLQSGDDARINNVLQGIRAYIKRHHSAKAEAMALQLLIDSQRFADLHTIAITNIIADATRTSDVAALTKIRAQAFLAAGDTAAAVSTAKAYYNVAALEDTADAVDQLALCLAAAHPQDSDIAERLKEQQVAWLAAPPSTQPDPGLGQPMLPPITLDSKPFDAAIAAITASAYPQLAAKGNLLLLAGKADDARKVFEQAIAVAPPNKLGEAYGSVARAIRAQSGCIAPANAYIASLRGGQ